MNKWFGIGFISKKGVELKYTPGSGKAVATYTLSVPREFTKSDKKEYDFINIVTWGKQAEWLANNEKKIKRLQIEGHIQTRSYDKKDGSKAYAFEVISDKIEVIEWNNDTSAPNNIAYNDNDFADNDMTEVEDSGDIPF